MQYFNMPLEQVNINVAISAYKEYYKTHKFRKKTNIPSITKDF